MALITSSYNYINHDGTPAIYLSRMDGLVAAITSVNSNWSKIYSSLYDTDYGLVIIEHVSGAQLAFVSGDGGSPFDGSPYTNCYDGNDGAAGYLYLCLKPSAEVTTFDTGSNPQTANWCSDAGAYKFHTIVDHVVGASGRGFHFVLDDKNPLIMCEYQDVTGSPGTPDTMIYVSDSTLEDGSLFRTGSLRPDDNRADFIMIWDDDNFAEDSGITGECSDKDGNHKDIKLGVTDAAYGVIDTKIINATYNPSQPWYISTMSLTINKSGFKGEISGGFMGFVREGAVAAKTSLGGGEYQHIDDGMVIKWDPTWSIT